MSKDLLFSLVKYSYMVFFFFPIIQSSCQRTTEISEVLGPLITIRYPLCQPGRIPSLEADLERFGLGSETGRDGIAFNRIKDGAVRLVLGRMHGECHDQTDVRRVEFTVGQVRAGTHPRASAVAVVRSSRAFSQVQVALRDKLGGHLEMVFVVVGCPSVLIVEC